MSLCVCKIEVMILYYNIFYVYFYSSMDGGKMGYYLQILSDNTDFYENL